MVDRLSKVKTEGELVNVTIKTRPTARGAQETPAREIREPEFAARLAQACDAHQIVPPLHSGRLTWIQRQLKTHYNEPVSVETVRKWFAGEAKPRADKLSKLAQLLEVDEAWLSLGVAHDITPRERVVRNAMADGVVNVIAGLIQMDGGLPAFPEENDEEAKAKNIDLHAIIRGGKFDIHVSMGEREGNQLRFQVPSKNESLVVLGVLRNGFAFEVYDISRELIATGHRKGVAVEVLVDPTDDRLHQIESFKQRL